MKKKCINCKCWECKEDVQYDYDGPCINCMDCKHGEKFKETCEDYIHLDEK